MNAKLMKKFLFVVVMLAMVVMALPRPVAAAATLSIEVIAVKAGESVTVRAEDFPANRTWTVRMDKAGNLGIDGIVVAEVRSAAGGNFEVNVPIPAELRNEKTIAIRFESTTGGWWVYNWFNNRNLNAPTNTPTPTPTPGAGVPVTGSKPSIRFVGVKANDLVVVEARDFAANTRIRVRVGPFETFFRDYVVVDIVNSGNNNPFRFTVKLPEVAKNAGMVTVRLDGDDGSYAYNAFRNVDSGTVSPAPTPTAPTTKSCELISVIPNRSVSPRADLDVIWTIKNTSGKDWDMASVDYKFVSGEKIYKHAAVYDLPQTVKAGETIKIVVDMIAPDKAGTYYTNWAVVSGSTTLCALPLTLTVR